MDKPNRLGAQKGFTLTEALVVLVVIAVLAMAVIAAINPLEQLRRAKDAAREQSAETLLSAIERYQGVEGENPEILSSASSLVCEDIVGAGPVYDISSLQNEVSSWFSRTITEPEGQLYVGLDEKRVRVCYQAESIVNVSKVGRGGCSVSYLAYLCLPR